MTANWFYARNGQRCGPFNFDQFRQLAASGMLQSTDMVFDESTEQWRSAQAVEGLFPPAFQNVAPMPVLPVPPSMEPQASQAATPPPLAVSFPSTSLAAPRPRIPPADIACQLAKENRLGRLVMQSRTRLGVQVGAGIGVAVVALIGLSRLTKALGHEDWFGVLAGIVLAVAAIAVIAGFVFEIGGWRRRSQIFIFEDGLVSVSDGTGQACRWDEVTTVWYDRNDIGNSRSRSYVLCLRDGRQISLANLKRFKTVAAIIRQTTQDRLAQQATVKINAGETVWFGSSLGLDLQGVTVAGAKSPWSDIKDIRPDSEGSIRLKKKSGWFETIVGHKRDIPNYFVFLALADRLLGKKTALRNSPGIGSSLGTLAPVSAVSRLPFLQRWTRRTLAIFLISFLAGMVMLGISWLIESILDGKESSRFVMVFCWLALSIALGSLLAFMSLGVIRLFLFIGRTMSGAPNSGQATVDQ